MQSPMAPLFAASLLGSTVVAAALAAQEVEPDAAEPQATPRRDSGPVRFEMAHGLVFVDLAFEGRSILALLDTGANASAIHTDRSEHLPALGEGEVLGTTGSLRAESVAVSGLALDALALPTLRATRRDLSGLLTPGRPVEFILGSDALDQLQLTIDFRRLELRVSEPRGSPGPAAMTLDQGIPTLMADIGGTRTRLRIDTGASLFETPDVYVNVPRSLWEELQRQQPKLEPVGHLTGTGAGGASVDLPVARVGAGTIGGASVPSVHVIVQPRVGYFGRDDALGFVGNNLLSKLDLVVLDYARERFAFRRR